MGATAGYTATVYISGTSTAMTGEACTEVEAGPPASYQITASTKQRLDTAQAITVYDNAVEVPGTDYTVDYLFGKITFGVSVTGPVTVDAYFLPVLSAGLLRNVTATVSRDELDTNVLGTVEKSFILGKRQATLEAESLTLLSEDLDTGGGSVVLDDLQSNATPKLVEYTAAGRTFRGWGFFPTLAKAIPQDGVITSNLTFTTSARQASGRSEIVAFSYEE
jgi:hypothetical protein